MKKLTFLAILLISAVAQSAPVHFDKTIIEMELTGIKRIYFRGVGMPQPVLNYMKGTAKEVFIETVADSAAGAKGLLGFNIDTGDSHISFGRHTHSYSCEILKKNGKITFVKGACFNQIVFTLPLKTRLEVYFQGERITPIFYAMTYLELMQNFKNTHFDEKRHSLVDEFLSTYKSTNTDLQFLTKEMKTILEQYIFTPSRLEGLVKLHKYVKDRSNLEQMINDIFIYPSDRREARKIVGI